MANARAFRNINLGIKSLMLHKMRSVLTMLGVVFGVASVIAMLAIGEGSKQMELDQIEKLGTNNIIISSMKKTDSSNTSRGQASFRQIAVYGLEYKDEASIREALPSVKRTVPVRRLPLRVQLKNRTEEMNVIGTTSEWFDLIKRKVWAGRTITAQDEYLRAPVIVLTEDAARKLLGVNYTVGQSIVVGNKVFTVIGIVSPESLTGGGGDRLNAYIPLSTCRSMFGEIIREQGAGETSIEDVELHRIIVESAGREAVLPTADVIRRLMSRLHPEEDYSISVPLELLERAKQIQLVWNWTLGSIAGISLLVGGIGIMNIMLASVTERTREVGIRRAIGAKKNQIIQQFLTEAMLLSITGGLIGLVLGAVILPAIITQASAGLGQEIRADPPLYSIVLSVGISVMVGVVFGLYPAIRAANLDPIEALRHE